MQTWQRPVAILALSDFSRIDRANMKINGRNGMVRQAVFGKILAAHGRIGCLNVVWAQSLFPDGDESFGQFRVVVSSGRVLIFQDRDNRSAVGWNSGRGCDSLCDPVDRDEDAIAHLRLVSADGKLHFYFVRNDIVLRPPVDRPDRDDNRVDRIVLPAGDGLPGIDHFRGQDDWVLGFVGIRAMATYTAYRYIN